MAFLTSVRFFTKVEDLTTEQWRKLRRWSAAVALASKAVERQQPVG